MNIILNLKDLKHGRDFFELKPSRGILYFTIILVSIFSLGFGLACFLEIDEVVKANAILRPVGTISSLRCIAGGQVRKKAYTHDMVVAKGQSLWEIDVQSDRLDLENSIRLIVQLKQDMRDMNMLLKTVTSDLNTVTAINSQAWIMSEAWIGELTRLKQQAEHLRVLLEREKAVPKNMSASQKVADLTLELASAQTEILNARARKQLACTENIKNLQQNIETIERRISDLERKIQDATVTAPISGRIDEIRRVNVGDYVMPGEEILKIIPQDNDSIKAELYVDPSHIARLKAGQKVFLRFPALPPSDFGQLEATISIVPADVSLGEGNIAIFVVEAELDSSMLTARNGEHIQLRSGMGAQARIKLSRETILRMILHKLDFIGKAQ